MLTDEHRDKITQIAKMLVTTTTSVSKTILKPEEGKYWVDNSEWPVITINQYRKGQLVKLLRFNTKTFEIEEFEKVLVDSVHP